MKQSNSNNPDLKAHATIARMVGAEGMVLLKNNEGTLPITGGTGALAIFGNTSYEIIVGGTGSGDVNEAYSISLTEGLANAGFSAEGSLEKIYRDYMAAAKASRPQQRRAFMPVEPIPEMELETNAIKEVANRTDLALITIGRNSGEFRDRPVEEFYLSETEVNLIKNVTEAYQTLGKKVVVVLNIGGVIETASWRGLPDAILLVWQPGQETGNAIADVLSGKVNPSGKLATTFPVKYEDHPSAATFPGEELPVEEPREEEGRRGFMRATPSVITYEDDIYVGYRYFEAFGVEPAYEFGYGLSYTNFSYGKLILSSKEFKGVVKAEVEVTNTGDLAGKEVVQLYIAAPGKSTNKPEKELKAFAKTRLLEPGESQVITFSIDPISLCSFDTAGTSWVAEKGDYTILAGSSSRDIRQKEVLKLAEILNAGTVTRSLLLQ
jgi:beta-glucosidase